MKKWLVWATFGVAAILLPAAFAASAAVRGAPSPTHPFPTPPGRAATTFSPAQASALKSPTLDSRLVALQQTSAKKGPVAAVNAASGMGLTTTGTRVRVIVDATDPLAARASIEAAGGTVEASAGDLLRAAVAPAKLSLLSHGSGVSYVRPPAHPAAADVTDEGVASTSASAWQALGRGGAGVKVAIVDLGFRGYAAAQTAGDLPASLTAVDDCEGNMTTGEVHGTAVAEIVHKMAPGAQLYLICVGDEVDLATAEQYVVANGITIVNHSVSWFNDSRGDGKGGPGTPDAIVKDARAHGVLWVNSAGNYADGGHWGGTLTAPLHGFQVFGKLNGQTADFDPVWIPYGQTACIALKWDKWPTTHEDFDLLMWDEFDSDPVATSTDDQDAQGLPPTEGFCYTNTVESDPSDQWFYVYVGNFHSTSKPHADLFAYGDAFLWFGTAAGSVTEPASSPSVLTAGAICWQNNAIESYSSRGPTIDGRVKPDISGPDATSSPVYGPFGGCGTSGFTGTSAASPHVAGAAALVEGVHPTWTPDQVQSFLTSSAKDLGSSGKDNTFGSGGVQLVLATPKVTSFSPSSAAVGATVTISGSNFLGSTSVDFDGATATPTSVTATSLKVVVPDGAITGPVTITNADGLGTSTSSFKVLPGIGSFDPLFDIRGHDVTVHGHTLTGATKVTFNSVSAGAAGTGFTVVDDHTITATIPPTGTTGKIAVTTPAGTATSASSFTVVLPPTVSSFSPTSAAFGQTVTINGTNLAHVSDAELGTTELAITPVSDTQLKVTVPDDATTGSFHLTDPAGENTVTSTSPKLKVLPRVDSFDPVFDVRGEPVTISGHNFTGATKVTFNGVTDTTAAVVDSQTIDAHVPPTATTGKVAVTTPGGTGTSSAGFTVVLPPTVSSFSPTSATFGQTVTINGTNLSRVTDALLGSTEVAITPVSDTQLKITVPDGATTDVFHLTNLAGQNTVTPSTPKLKVLPKIDSFTPTFEIRNNPITITGHNFTGATKVTFNGVSATFTQDSDTQITATIPPTATTGKLAVTTPGGTATSAASFTVVLPPTVSSFSPTSAPVGTTVTINGTNLAHVTAARLATTDLAITPVSDTQLKVTIPVGASTNAFLLDNAAGSNTVTTSTAKFKVVPRVDSFDTSPDARGHTVTIHGHNFTGATKVTFNGASAPVNVVDDETITTTVPNTATTGKVAVTTSSGTGTSAGNFAVVLPAAVSSFSPSSGTAGTTVTISGTNLAYVDDVTLGGVDLGAPVQSGSQIKVTINDAAVTGKLQLHDAAGLGPQSSGTFKVVPRITDVSTEQQKRGGPVTIFGYSFTGATKVTFNGVSVGAPGTDFQVSDDGTQITTTVPMTATTGKLAVTTPGGTATTTRNFEVVLPPTITSFSPASGPVGTRVTIIGTNLERVRTITINGGSNALYSSTATQAIAVVRVDSGGAGSITVANIAGSASLDGFKVPPTVTSLSPDAATGAAVGDQVRITGTNLAFATVKFNGADPDATASGWFEVDTSVPPGATTGPVLITTAGGSVTVDSYKINPTPTAPGADLMSPLAPPVS